MPLMTWLFVVLTLLCIGSVIACFTYRLPLKWKVKWAEEAKEYLEAQVTGQAANALIVSKRSQCPHCNTILAIRDLIPLLSYFINRTKCRFCGKRISIRYPLIEVIYLLLLLPIFYVTNNLIEVLLLSLIWTGLYMVAVIDFEHMFVLDELIVFSLFAVFSFHLYAGHELERYVLGTMIGYASIYLVRLAYLKLKNIEGIGLGDASLMAAIGALLGPQSIYYVLILACVFGVVGHFLSKNKQVPFAPSLVAATAIVYYAGFL